MVHVYRQELFRIAFSDLQFMELEKLLKSMKDTESEKLEECVLSSFSLQRLSHLVCLLQTSLCDSSDI